MLIPQCLDIEESKLNLNRSDKMFTNTKRKNAAFGRYPCCDLVNNAIRHILHGDNDSAIEELLQAIWKADGYVHEDLKNDVQKIHERVGRNGHQFKVRLSQLNAHLDS